MRAETHHYVLDFNQITCPQISVELPSTYEFMKISLAAREMRHLYRWMERSIDFNMRATGFLTRLYSRHLLITWVHFPYRFEIFRLQAPLVSQHSVSVT